jgi:hypothetical protein
MSGNRVPSIFHVCIQIHALKDNIWLKFCHKMSIYKENSFIFLSVKNYLTIVGLDKKYPKKRPGS